MKNNQKVWVLVAVILISILVRLQFLGRDSINPDAVNWHYRCQQFANGIKYFQFEKTYQHYHPGVTLCWAMAIPTEIYKKLASVKEYNVRNFESFNFINTFSVVLIISILIGMCFWQIEKILYGLLFVLFLTIEPFFYGNSRIIHLDVTHSLFVLLSFLLLKKYVTNLDRVYLIMSAISLGFGFLTKSITVVFLVSIMISFLFLIKREKLKDSLIFFGTFVLTVFIFFPALWVAPFFTIYNIFSEAARVGVNNSHNQFFLGEFYDDELNPGFLFYPLAFLIKFSPILIIGIFFIFKDIVKFLENTSFKKLNNFDFWVFFSVILYLFAIFYSSKKVDRYLIVLMPILIYYLLYYFEKYLKTSILLALINIYSLFAFYPTQFLYYSPIFLNYPNVNSLIGQKSFGMDIFDLKDYLLKNYGEVRFGFYDIKPMETIYANSKVFDIREVGPSKVDIVILSINEELPEDYKEVFHKKESYFLKDIPLYDIYVKN